MTNSTHKKVLKEVDNDLANISRHFGLNTDYARKVAWNSTKVLAEPRAIIFLNSFIGENRKLIEASMTSVIELEEVDIKKGLEDSMDNIKELALWAKENSRDKKITAMYVVDEELIGGLTYKKDPELWKIKDIFEEKAVDYSHLLLESISDVFRSQGVEMEIQIQVGNPYEELNNELGENDVLQIGSNNMAREAEKYFSSKIVQFHKNIEFVPVKALDNRLFGDNMSKMGKLEKLTKYISTEIRLKDTLALDGGKKKKQNK